MSTLKRFGDLEPGDVILGADGQEVTVVKTYDEHTPEKMYEITMEDNTTIKASGNHLWYVETSIDYGTHRTRRKKARQLLKNLDPKKIQQLDNIANMGTEEEVETSLIDIITLLNAENNPDMFHLLVRIAESLGHISESNITLQDVINQETETYSTVPGYDAKQFAQQILSLTGIKKYKKKYPLIIGKVITTEELLNINSSINIPFVKQLKDRNQKKKKNV